MKIRRRGRKEGEEMELHTHITDKKKATTATTTISTTPHLPSSLPPSSLLPLLTQAINDLGGAVVPKFSWSVPLDAMWVNGGTLKCETAGDVLLLLKSSAFVRRDLEEGYEGCVSVGVGEDSGITPSSSSCVCAGGVVGEEGPSSYHLTLRKHCTFHPSHHFRCFIHRQTLIAISQRDPSLHFPYLKEEVPQLGRVIPRFFTRHVHGRFPVVHTHTHSEAAGGEVGGEGGEGNSGCYVIDVYVDKRERVWVMDFDVWAGRTEGLLFEWEELEGGREGLRRRREEDGGEGVWVKVDVGDSDTHNEDKGLLFRAVELEREEGEGGEGDAHTTHTTALAPDPLSTFRVPVEMHMGGGLDMEALMRLTLAQRQGEEEEGEEESEEEGE